MIVSIDQEAAVVRKQATSAAEAARLANEALLLGVARHPGVVRLLHFDGRVLETRWVPSGGSAGALSPPEMATLATTLADLHAIGVVHGAIEPSHVLVTGDGSPVLCGFGQGARGVSRRDPAVADDVAALAAMLRSQASGPLAAVLDQAIRKHWSAERLAAACARSGEPAAPPGRLAAARPRGGERPRRRAAPCAGWGRRATGPWRRAAPFVAASIALAVAVGPGRPSPRFELGQPGDQVVFGRWHCEHLALPALLRRPTGTVWVWDHWPAAGNQSPGHLLARARRLTVRPGRPGCDRLILTPPGP